MPSEVEDAKSAPNSMAAKNFERNDERILHEVGVYGSVEDVYRAVVRTRGKERVGWVIVDRANGPGLVPGGQSEQSFIVNRSA